MRVYERTAEEYHHYEWRYKEHGDDHRKSPEKVAGFLYLPHIVEYLFNIHHHPDHDPEEEQGRDKTDSAALRGVDYVLGESEYRVYDLLAVVEVVV